MIGQALALLHKQAADPWTISNLARRTGLSRSRLTERFRHLLGSSPMAYLAQWRLKLGAEILQKTEDTVAEVAAAVGYGSEAAFNRAFKREFRCPPAQFRRQRKEARRSPWRKASTPDRIAVGEAQRYPRSRSFVPSPCALSQTPWRAPALIEHCVPVRRDQPLYPAGERSRELPIQRFPPGESHGRTPIRATATHTGSESRRSLST